MSKKPWFDKPEITNWTHEHFRSFRWVEKDGSFGPLLRQLWRVGKILGAGSESIVILLSPLDLGPDTRKPAALKILHEDLSQSGRSDIRARMVREGKFLRKCAGPHVVRLEGFAHIVATDETALVLEPLVDSNSTATNLFDATHADPPPSLESVIQWFEMCLRGVESLHMQGIAHRDIKLDNFCADAEKKVKLVDLALSLPVTEMKSGQRILSGNPSYWPPENLRTNDPLSVDLYALCIILSEMLLRRMYNPWKRGEKDLRKLVELAESARVALHRELDASALPRGLVDFVKRGTGASAGPNDRYTSIQQMQMAFDHATLNL